MSNSFFLQNTCVYQRKSVPLQRRFCINILKTVQKHCKNTLKYKQNYCKKGEEAMRREGKRIRVSDFEFHLPRPTYTANTLRALAREYPEHEFTLIIGEDNLSIFDKWREYQYILDNYRIFVYPRHGNSTYTLPHAKDLHVLTGAPYFDISSTELRVRQQDRIDC